MEVEKYLDIMFNNCTPYTWARGLKPSHAGKLVVHRCDSWKCREFLCIIPKNFGPICAGGHLSETWMLETPLPFYQSAWCHIPEDHNLDTLWYLWMATDYDHLSLYDFPCSDCTASNERTFGDDESCKECGSNSL